MLALLHYKQTVTCREVVVRMTNKHTQLFNINIDAELSITMEKQLKEKEVSIGEEKGTSVFYSVTATYGIDEETVAKISATEYSADKYNEQIALNNFKKELRVHIQKPVKIIQQF